MKVLALSEIKTARGVVPRGRIIEVTPGLLEKIKGRVQIIHSDIKKTEEDYFKHLACFWELDQTATGEEVEQMLGRLDYLFQTLHRQGQKVPVRLPTEKRKVA